MAIILFGNGSIEEKESVYEYSISLINQHISSSVLLDRLYDSEQSYEHEVVAIDQTDKNLKIVYQKKEAPLMTLDQAKSLKGRKILFKNQNLKNEFCLKLMTVIEKEYEKGFFVLPIPDNILVDNKLNPYYIYKAVEGMPIMGYDFKDIFSYLKILIQYIYGDMTFEKLSNSNIIQTNDNFLYNIFNCQNFFELKQLIGYEPTLEHNEISSEKIVEEHGMTQAMLDTSISEEIQEVIIQEPKNDKVFPEYQERTKERTTKHNQFTEVRQEPIKQVKLVKSISVLTIIFGVLFIVSFSLNLFLGIDKLTMPSRLSAIKSELKVSEESLSVQREKNNDLEKEMEQLKKDHKKVTEENQELKEELETNSVMIEKVINQNETLKKELKNKK